MNDPAKFKSAFSQTMFISENHYYNKSYDFYLEVYVRIAETILLSENVEQTMKSYAETTNKCLSRQDQKKIWPKLVTKLRNSENVDKFVVLMIN